MRWRSGDIDSPLRRLWAPDRTVLRLLFCKRSLSAREVGQGTTYTTLFGMRRQARVLPLLPPHALVRSPAVAQELCLKVGLSERPCQAMGATTASPKYFTTTEGDVLLHRNIVTPQF